MGRRTGRRIEGKQERGAGGHMERKKDGNEESGEGGNRRRRKEGKKKEDVRDEG